MSDFYVNDKTIWWFSMRLQQTRAAQKKSTWIINSVTKETCLNLVLHSYIQEDTMIFNELQEND